MKKYIAILIVIFSTNLLADYQGSVSINRVRIDGTYVYFGVTPQPANTCSNWGEHLKFDHTTDKGKSFLSALLTAKSSGSKIDLWYHASTNPGTNESNGCGGNEISIMVSIAIK